MAHRPKSYHKSLCKQTTPSCKIPREKVVLHNPQVTYLSPIKETVSHFMFVHTFSVFYYIVLLFTIFCQICDAKASMVTSPQTKQECVILLHGLARTSGSMNKIARALKQNGYHVINISYPSRQKTIQELSEIAVSQGIARCAAHNAPNIHFVSHSLGGILVRYYLTRHNIENLGRVVMLAPPNQGSEIVDSWKNIPGFAAWNGPAGLQLGTNPTSIPRQLDPVNYPVGIIAGTKTINPLLSHFLPSPNDGKVSVESTKVEGMTDFITVPVSHTFIMRNNEVIAQIKAFLRSGSFSRK